MAADRLTWLRKLTNACDHTISELEHRGDPLASPLIDNLKRLRARLQAELDDDAG